MSLSSWLKKPASDPSQLVLVDALPRELWRALEDGHVPPFHQALPQLAYEVARARRYERPLTIALFTADGVAAESQLNGHLHLPPVPPPETEMPGATRSWVSSALMTGLLATLLRESLREADIVTYAPRFGLCIVAMPETDTAGARHTVLRIQTLCVQRLLTPVRAGVAEFSKAGWTLEELIRQAEADAIQETAVESSLPSTA